LINALEAGDVAAVRQALPAAVALADDPAEEAAFGFLMDRVGDAVCVANLPCYELLDPLWARCHSDQHMTVEQVLRKAARYDNATVLHGLAPAIRQTRTTLHITVLKTVLGTAVAKGRLAAVEALWMQVSPAVRQGAILQAVSAHQLPMLVHLLPRATERTRQKALTDAAMLHRDHPQIAQPMVALLAAQTNLEAWGEALLAQNTTRPLAALVRVAPIALQRQWLAAVRQHRAPLSLPAHLAEMAHGVAAADRAEHLARAPAITPRRPRHRA